jgi:thiosulfate/3-mercaptopyruvate sulfurtransferase
VPDQVNQTRVAWTLGYAGVASVGILDGGFNKWTADKKPVSTDDVKVAPAKAEVTPRKSLPVLKDEVTKKLGKVILLDTRTPDYFFGIVKVPMAAREGRLPTSVNLPSAWMFTKEGAFKPVAELQAMAEGVVGKDKAAEIITYCDTGRLASGWTFVLSDVLGYRNVRMYDGSTQEWTADPAAPMVRYSWK